jgi:hypothetical protein
MLGSKHGAGMNKMEALAERARLQKLLDSYDGSRLAQREEDERTERARDGTPDRAGNVRARIARLDELISDIENDESS